MIEINFVPVYGAIVGLNYWNDTMSEDDQDYDDCQHIIQVFLFIFGINFIWYEKYK